MKKRITKIFKIVGVLLLLLFIILVVLFYRFSSPKSDEVIQQDFAKKGVEVFINQQEFNEFKYRVLATQKVIDTTLPTIFFIHGAIGSASDFKNYLVDENLNDKANLLAYDRVGYGLYQTGNAQASIAFEIELLKDLIKTLDKQKTIVVGYSYGGPIALGIKEELKKIVLLAPAVYSKVEPMPWALNLYQWNTTRWLMPKAWQAASKEKISHIEDLKLFESEWNTSSNEIISIHGNADWIVPYENSLYLEEHFSSNQFELVTLKDAGHGLVWTHFNEIKNILLQQLK